MYSFMYVCVCIGIETFCRKNVFSSVYVLLDLLFEEEFFFFLL
jgi:hypothetical protein